MAVNGGEASKWEIVRDALRTQITSGQLRVGDPIPSEHDLVETFKVSRNTIRDALKALEGEGLIGKASGGRTRLVRAHDLMPFHASLSESRTRGQEVRPRGVDRWVADVTDQGRVPGEKLSIAVIAADDALARRLRTTAEGEALPAEAATLLGLPSEDTGQTMVLARSRVRTVDGQPHNLCISYYMLRLVQDTKVMMPLDIPEGVIAYMAEQFGYIQVWYRDEIEARPPTPEEIKQLDLPQSGASMILHIRTAYAVRAGHEDGAMFPVRVTVTHWPGNRCKILYGLPA